MVSEISKWFGAYTFYFENAEDFQWGYELYKDGEECASLKIIYFDEDSGLPIVEQGNSNTKLLKSLSSNIESINRLEKYLKCYEDGEYSNLHDSFEEFVSGFGVEEGAWLCYEEFWFMGSDGVKELGAIKV